MLFAIDVGNFNNGNVKGSAAQVIYRNLAICLVLLIKTKGQGSCGRLIDDALDFETSNTASIFGRLALTVIEVSRHSNDRFGHFFTQIIFCRLFHFAQNFSRDLLWRHFFITGLNPCIAVIRLNNFVWHEADVFLYFFVGKFTAHQALYRIHGVAWVGNRLAFRRRANKHFAVFHIGNNRRGCTSAFGVFNHARGAVFNYRNARVGGS